MQVYQVVYPFSYSISADSFNNAIKNFAKLHYDMNLNHVIITDQNKHMQARLKNYTEDGRNLIGINVFPYKTPFDRTGLPYFGMLPAPGMPMPTPFFNPMITSNVKSAASPINPQTSILPSYDMSGNRYYTIASSPIMSPMMTPMAPMSPHIPGGAVISSTVPPPSGSTPLMLTPSWSPTIISYNR